MAPRETDTCPSADGVSPPADSNGLKVVSLAMELPVVNDAVSAASAVAGPYMDTLLGRCSPVMDNLPALPCGFKETVGSAVDSLDSLACSGLELLTEQVPSLAIPTPDLLEITKDTAFEYLGQAADYLASFKAAQVCLVAGDRGLETAQAAVGALGGGTKTIRRMRRGARAARRAGARRARPATQARTIGEASLLGTLAEIFNVNYLLAFIGLQLAPAAVIKKQTRIRKNLEPSTEPYSPSQKFGDLDLSHYDSEQDSDYSPSEASDMEDELEYNSDAEQVYEDEHARVLEGDSSDESEQEIHAEDYETKADVAVVADEAIVAAGAVVPQPGCCPHVSKAARPPSADLVYTTDCSVCGDSSESWLCLTCHVTNCSRYKTGHQVAHHATTGHALALSHTDLSVWCFDCDKYVDDEKFSAAKLFVHEAKFGAGVPAKQ